MLRCMLLIEKQEMLLRAQMQQQQIHDNPPTSQGIVISQSMEMTTVADPFLGQSNVSANHIKQESSDSGVGKYDSRCPCGGFGRSSSLFFLCFFTNNTLPTCTSLVLVL